MKLIKQSKIFNPIYGGQKLREIISQDVEHRKQFISVGIIQKIGLSYLKRHKIRRLIESKEKVNEQLLQFTFDQLLIHSKLNLIGKRLLCGTVFSSMLDASENSRIANSFTSNKLFNKTFAALRSYLQDTTLDQADLENIGRIRKVLGQRTIAKTLNFWKLRLIFLRQLNSNVNYIDVVKHMRANYTILVPFSNFLNNYCKSRQQALLFRTHMLTKYCLGVTFCAWRAIHYSSNKDRFFELRAQTYQIWHYGSYFHAIFVQKRTRLTILKAYIQRWKIYIGFTVEEDQNNRFANKFYVSYLQRKYFGLYMRYVFCSNMIKKSRILRILYGDSSMIQQKQAYPIVRTTYINYFLSLSSESFSPISSAIKCLLAWRRVCGYRAHFAKFVAVFQVRFQILKLRHKLRCWKLASKGRDRYSKLPPKEIILEPKTALFLMNSIQQEYMLSSFVQQNYQYCVSSSQFGIYLIKDQYSAEEDDLLMFKFQSKLLLYSNKQLEGIVTDFMSTKNNSDTATFMFSNLIKIWALSRKKSKVLNIDKRPNEDRVTAKDFHHMAKMYEKMLTIRYVSFLFSCEMGFGKRFINDEMRRYSTSIVDILRRRFPQVVDYMVQNKKCEFNLVSHSFNTTQPSFLAFTNNSVVSIAYLLNYFLQGRTTNIEQPDFGLFSSFKKFNKYGIVTRAQEATKRNKETQRAIVAERLRKKFPKSEYFNIRSNLNDWLASCLACAMEKEFLQLYKLRSGAIQPIISQALSRVGVQQTSYMSYADLGNELGNDFVTQTHAKKIDYVTTIKQAIHMTDADAFAVNEIYKKSKMKGDNLNDTFDDQGDLEQILDEVGQALNSEILVSFINVIKQRYQGCLTQNIVNKTLEFVQIMKSLLDQNPNTHINVYVDDFLSQLDQEQTSVPGKQAQFDEYGDIFQNPGTNAIDQHGKSGITKTKQVKDFMSQFRKLNPTNNIVVEQSGLTIAQRRALMKKLRETEKLENEQQQIQEKLGKSRLDQLTLDQTKQLSYFESMLSQSLDGSLLTALENNDQQFTKEQEQMIDAEIEKMLVAQGIDPDRAKSEAKRRRINYVNLKLKQQSLNQSANICNSQQKQQFRSIVFHDFLINEKTFNVLNVNTLSNLNDKKGRTIKYDKIRDIFQVGKILIQPSDLETYLLKQGIKFADFKVQKQAFLTQQGHSENSSVKQPKPIKNSTIAVLQNIVKYQNKNGNNQESLSNQNNAGAYRDLSELKTQQSAANKIVTSSNNLQCDAKGNYFVLDERGQIKYCEQEEIDSFLSTNMHNLRQLKNSFQNADIKKQFSSKEEQSSIQKQEAEFVLQESEVNDQKVLLNLEFKEQLLMKIIDDRLKIDENDRKFFVDDQGIKFFKDETGYYVETVDENGNIIRDLNVSPVFESYTVKQNKYQPSISILQKRKKKERDQAINDGNEDQILVVEENGDVVFVNKEDISQTDTDDSENSVYNNNNDQIANDSLLLFKAIRKRRKFLEAIRKRNLRLQKQIEMEYVSDNEYEYLIQNLDQSVYLAQLQGEGQMPIVKPKRLQYVFESNQIRFKRQTSQPFLSTQVNQYALGIKRPKSIDKMGENHIEKYNCFNATSFNPNGKTIDIQDSYYFQMHLHTKPTPFIKNGLVKHKLYDYSKTKQQRDLETTMQHIGVRTQTTKIKQDSLGEKFLKDVQDRLDTMKKQQDGFNIIDIVCKRGIVGVSNVGFEDADIKLEELRAFQEKISTMENKQMDLDRLFKRFDGLFSKMNMLVMGEKAKKMQHQIMKAIEKEEEEDRFAIDLETIVNYTGDTQESYQVKQERIERRRLRLAKERIAQQKKYSKEQNDQDEMEAARQLVKCNSEGKLVADPRFDRRKVVLFEPKADYSDYIHDLVHGRRFVRG